MLYLISIIMVAVYAVIYSFKRIKKSYTDFIFIACCCIFCPVAFLNANNFSYNSIIVLAIAISISFIYSIGIFKRKKSVRVERNKVIGDFGNIKLSAEINKINRDKSVTDGDINLYYKMYLKKWELDYEDEWVTDKIGYYKIGGWEFLESMVSDLFVGIGPNR